MPRQRKPKPVQGYMFSGSGNMEDRDETVCTIIERATNDNYFENGCSFIVEFADGFRTEAYATELTPWYPI